jgi:hypothetical protein
MLSVLGVTATASFAVAGVEQRRICIFSRPKQNFSFSVFIDFSLDIPASNLHFLLMPSGAF